MKRELLEEIIRLCVNEVLEIVPVVGGNLKEAETVGAPAPPAAGQGTGDAPAMPKEEPPVDVPQAPTKGIFLVNPKKPNAKPVQLQVKQTDDANLERLIHRPAAKLVGPTVQTAANTIRSVKNHLAGTAPVVYLYVGRQNTDDPHLTVLATNSLPSAIQGSVPPEEASAEYGTYQMAPPEPSTQMTQQGPEAAAKTQVPKIDEKTERITNMISAMVREALKECRK